MTRTISCPATTWALVMTRRRAASARKPVPWLLPATIQVVADRVRLAGNVVVGRCATMREETRKTQPEIMNVARQKTEGRFMVDNLKDADATIASRWPSWLQKIKLF